MRIDVLTLFPKMIREALDTSIAGRAVAAGLLQIAVHDLRNWATDRHRTVDDAPYGGGPGMVMKCEPVVAALAAVREMATDRPHVIFPTPDGQPFTQRTAIRLASERRLVFLCGHYEGLDQRVRDTRVDEEISLGDFVLTGGELPSLVIIDALIRHIPGVLGNPESAEQDSFGRSGLLDHAHYTRPAIFQGMAVPHELLGGDHGAVEKWRRNSAMERTIARRPDLIVHGGGFHGVLFGDLTGTVAPVPTPVSDTDDPRDFAAMELFQRFIAKALWRSFPYRAMTIAEGGLVEGLKTAGDLLQSRAYAYGFANWQMPTTVHEQSDFLQWLRQAILSWPRPCRHRRMLGVSVHCHSADGVETAQIVFGTKSNVACGKVERRWDEAMGAVARGEFFKGNCVAEFCNGVRGLLKQCHFLVKPD